jgi:hypothetical protein
VALGADLFGDHMSKKKKQKTMQDIWELSKNPLPFTEKLGSADSAKNSNPGLVLVRNIHNTRVHLGGGHTIAPGESEYVNPDIGEALIARGFAMHLDPGAARATD